MARSGAFRFGMFALAATAFCAPAAFTQVRSADSMQIMMNQQNAKDQSAGLSADKSFLKSALQGSLAVVQASQLALQRSSSDQVKQFAQHMVDDHAQLDDQLKPIAANLSVKAPTEPPKKEKAEITKLQGLTGADFDKAYVQLMLKDHEADAEAFKHEEDKGQSPALKDAVTKADPVIQSHLKMIQDIAKSMNIS